MKELFSKLRELISNFKSRANEALKNLPPIEQFEASSEVAFGIRCLRNGVQYLEESAGNMDRNIASMEEQMSALFKAEVDKAVTEKLGAGYVAKEELSAKYVTKDEAKQLAETRASEAEKAVRDEFAKVASRRVELSAKQGDKGPVMSLEAAFSLPHAVLVADNYADQAKKVTDRLKQLDDLGLKMSSVRVELAGLPLDESGDKIFGEKMATFREIAGTKSTERSGDASLAGAGASANDGGEKIGICF